MNVTMSMNNVLNIVHAMALTTNNKKWLGERLIEEAKAETKQKAQLHKGDSATSDIITTGPLKGFRRMHKEDIQISPVVAMMFSEIDPLPTDFNVKEAYSNYLHKKYQ